MLRVHDRILYAFATAMRALIGVSVFLFGILGSAWGQTTDGLPLAGLGLVHGQNAEVAWTLDPASAARRPTPTVA